MRTHSMPVYQSIRQEILFLILYATSEIHLTNTLFKRRVDGRIRIYIFLHNLPIILDNDLLLNIQLFVILNVLATIGFLVIITSSKEAVEISLLEDAVHQ